ncbi:hypothetical protein HPB48_003027 [Haemaphysalis longicornis]|uniref:Uncharacterized protein n=1 Tax=Haemaphysalis longicornis TaxID=44386 RepID=A0A9J6FE43_HAELO|nr:hypothetical protein HPB48_003027 [Haemaphysalis longicornis]
MLTVQAGGVRATGRRRIPGWRSPNLVPVSRQERLLRRRGQQLPDLPRLQRGDARGRQHGGAADSFLCGNQTVFNQLSLTCAFAEEAVPCNNAPDFFYVNDNIGVETAPFLTDNDVQRAAQLIPSYKAKA